MTDAADLSTIELSTFGRVALRTSDGAGLPVSSRKALALLTFLCVSPGRTASRDKLADLLWPDRGSEQARSSLRQTLTVLRRELGPSRSKLVQADRDVVALDTRLIRSDAEAFLAALADHTEDSLREAATLYAGPFLDGFSSGSAEFEDWAAGERERFHSLAAEALEGLARRVGRDGGLTYAKRLLALDTTREASYRLAMELHAAAGHRDKALQLYESCRAAMSRTFDVEPSPETVTLRARIAADAPLASLPDNSPPMCPGRSRSPPTTS